jgi:hypothetical protein
LSFNFVFFGSTRASRIGTQKRVASKFDMANLS